MLRIIYGRWKSFLRGRILMRFLWRNGRRSMDQNFAGSFGTRSQNSARFIVVEGPAGAGKSTFCDRLGSEVGLPVIRSPLTWGHGPISRVPGFALELDALLNDVRRTIAAAAVKRVILDRWFLSGYVYRVLRGWGIPAEFPDYILTAKSFLARMVRIADLRLSEVSPPPTVGSPVWLRFVILIPPVETIERFRQSAGKEYPFDAGHERNVYSQIAGGLGPEAYVIEDLNETDSVIQKLLSELKQLGDGGDRDGGLFDFYHRWGSGPRGQGANTM